MKSINAERSKPVIVNVDLPGSLLGVTSCLVMIPSINTSELPLTVTLITTRVRGSKKPDGKRLWLIDWDYAGFNSPLFDLSNLASNNEVTEPDERWLLESYFERPLTPALWRSYRAMKCASLLRETMWSMVQEIHSELDFDYPAYTADYRGRLERMYEAFKGN